MAEYKAQEQDLVFALDIGTRSIVGVVGRPAGGRLKVLDIEMAEHGSRAMLDGQIDNIQQVAGLARVVTERLEERLGSDFADRFDEAQSRYLARLVEAYYLFGLGLRQEVLSALAGPYFAPAG